MNGVFGGAKNFNELNKETPVADNTEERQSRSNGSLDDIRKSISGIDEKSPLRGVADFLMSKMEKLSHNLEIHSSQEDWDDLASWDKESKGKAGLYFTDNISKGKQYLFINPSAKNNAHTTFLHELTHAYTVEALENPQTELEKTFSENIKTLYGHFKQNFQPTDRFEKYKISDASEFVAYAMTDKNFQEKLDAVDDTVTGKPVTIWEKIKDFIRNLFGKKYDPTVLDSVLV